MSIRPRHLMSLADLTPTQINRVLTHSAFLKKRSIPWVYSHLYSKKKTDAVLPPQSLFLKTIALLFSKRSTRTRLAAETSAELLGGKALFLGKEDIQLGVNESVRDSAIIMSGMCQGIFARVGEHSEIEELAKYSNVPVLNALSSLWHPTQVLADILTLHETLGTKPTELDLAKKRSTTALRPLPALTIAYVGDSANVLHDMLITYPRIGHDIRVAAPPGYGAPKEVWDTVKALDIFAEGPALGSMEGTEGLRKKRKEEGVEGIGREKSIFWTHDPREAVTGADVVITDTCSIPLLCPSVRVEERVA
ncbi:hypothetical protein D9619_008859 [Psilocybe cf. subviscida]|uniref:ornithine carbamoyltransferase n=1 Tax=Psilocybe cf. subviscida TaxID=2480587 RepID=A0A8H5BBZ3_9AGAR|nr:hypothetical protein D9619_008859 [Psilocybe cf. subviscida]